MLCLFYLKSTLQEKFSTTEQNLELQAKDSQQKIEALHKQLQEAKTAFQVSKSTRYLNFWQ